jgi:gliding motility-associated-like protein
MKKSHFVFSILFLLNLCGLGQAPTPTILVSSPVLCSGQTATFTAKSSTLTPTSIDWTVTPLSGVNQLSSPNDSLFILQFLNPGRYVIALRWEFDVLGAATKTIAVNVTRSAESAFNASLTTYGLPNEIRLTDFSVNSSKIYWVFDNNFSNKDSSAQTSRMYTSSGTFTVLHIALGPQGCNDTSTYKFTLVDESKLELPTAFSPNGDGINDVYRPSKLDAVISLKIQIYNRFGIQVAAWETVNGFWDGRTTSGLACDEGTYFVIAEGKGADGKEYKLKTSLNLFR